MHVTKSVVLAGAVATLAMLLGVRPSEAQFSEGRVTGIVRDESGAPMVGASVAIVDQETGIARRLSTSSTGVYAAPDLRPSRYRIEIDLPGFIRAVERDVRVNAGTTLTLDVTLTITAVAEKLVQPAESVTVLGGLRLVNLAQSQVSQVVQQETIQSLPLNGRNFLELAFLVPGNTPTATYDPTKSRVVEVSSAGQVGRGGNVSVDGVDNNDDFVGGVVQNFSVDAVQEFQVVTNRYSAEIGRSATSVVNVVTRSGSNDVHGGGSFFYRSKGLSSDNPLVDETGKTFNRKQYSATLGGPIKKDKAFWFLSYERTDEAGAEIAGERIYNPPGTSPPGRIRTFFTPAPFKDDLLLARFDWQATADDKLFLRFSHQKNSQTNQGFLRGGATVGDVHNLQVADNRIDAVVAGWTKILGPTLVNSFRAHYNDFKNSIVAMPGAPTPELQLPSITEGANFRVPQSTVQKRIEIKDDLNWTKGSHALKFGFDLQPKIETRVFFYLFGSGTVILAQDFATQDANGDGSVDDLDIPIAAVIKDTSPTIPTADQPDNQYLGLYVQDDWRVRDNLTINAGLRWEVDFNVKNKALSSPFGPQVQRGTELDNLSPRVGFAWDPWRNGKQALRGGYGIYYDRIVLEVPFLELLLNGRNLPIALFQPASLSDPLCEQSPCARGNVPVGRNTVANDLSTPMNQQFSLGFQRQLGKDYALSVDGVYNKGTNYILGVEVNQPRAGRPFLVPSIPDKVVQLGNVAKTDYKAVLATLQRRMSHGVSFLASYTLSKARTYSNDDQIPFADIPIDDPLDAAREFSWAGNDERHRFVLSGTFEAPWGIRISPILTLSSGVPFDVRQGTDFDGDGVPDRFPLLPRNAGGREVTTGEELNALIDQFNSDPRYAELRRIRGRGYEHVDPGLQLTHPFRTLDVRFSKLVKAGKLSVEVLAEVFNLFDDGGSKIVGADGKQHRVNVRGFFLPSYAGIATNMESPVFGKPLSTAGGAFGSGGPRALQLGGKLSF